jgi:Flp pilus assembly pilin Flp
MMNTAFRVLGEWWYVAIPLLSIIAVAQYALRVHLREDDPVVSLRWHHAVVFVVNVWAMRFLLDESGFTRVERGGYLLASFVTLVALGFTILISAIFGRMWRQGDRRGVFLLVGVIAVIAWRFFL